MLARKSEPRPGPFTWDEYMKWEGKQEEKWELVDGYAVRRSDRWWFDPVTGMAGATRAHNRIAANLITGFNNRLDGGPCWAVPSDLKTRSPTGSGRYPDVTVECGGAPADSLLSAEPRVLIEVLSPSNSFPDQLRLLEDYQAIPSVQQIVFIEQERTRILSWTRAIPPPWPLRRVEDADGELDFPSLRISFAMAEIYKGLELA